MSLIRRKESSLFPTFDSLWDDLFDTRFFNRGLELGTSIPATNISETDEAYNLEIAVPGFKKEDFTVDIEDNVLTVSSEKEEEKEEKEDEKVTRKEFSYSSFTRSFQLPDNVMEEGIDATYADGILKLTLPKKELSKVESKKQIEIK